MSANTHIRTKSVRSDIHPRRDGLRILVTRIRGRGLSKERYDTWMANLGLSEQLLDKIQSDKVIWQEFKRAYKAELFQSADIDKRNELIRNKGQKFTLRLIQRLAQTGNVTLLCHCAEDEMHCHRYVLKQILDGKI